MLALGPERADQSIALKDASHPDMASAEKLALHRVAFRTSAKGTVLYRHVRPLEFRSRSSCVEVEEVEE